MVIIGFYLIALIILFAVLFIGIRIIKITKQRDEEYKKMYDEANERIADMREFFGKEATKLLQAFSDFLK